MSWSFNGIGKPDALKRALDTQSEGMTAGQSKDENVKLEQLSTTLYQ